MDKKLYLSFLWHMHQPYYRDDLEGKTLMPWVFLHGIKDYHEIPWYLSRYPELKATFNLVPSLLDQLQQYIDGSANDMLLEILRKDVSALAGDDVEVLNRYLFLANEKHMITPLPRYNQLFRKFQNSEDGLGEFSAAEILDTQVLFLLSWCGNYLRRNSEFIASMIAKGREYSHADKMVLLDTLAQFLKEIVPLYKQMAKSGQIALSTTPYYHPILPLLLNRQSAREARADAAMPKYEHELENFAKKQVQDAVDYFKTRFGKAPSGFWPSEGSVSMKTAHLLQENGIKWCCSDEDILFKTLGSSKRKNLYCNYELQLPRGGIDIRFRDRRLSDMIGFEFSNQEPRQAVKHFMATLREIYESSEENPLVNVILDGENAWEFYPQNAEQFFSLLYEELQQTPWLETVTMDEIHDDPAVDTREITKLASGSWINGNFDIWIGHEEKNRAWELIDMTYDSYLKHKDTLEETVREQIERELMIAMGSDWFWWYGDDHYTTLKGEFDLLFRKHLVNVYKLMKKELPQAIATPVLREKPVNSFHSKPKSFITPNIDGRITNYFDWLDAGKIDLKKEFSAMDSKQNIVSMLRYGYDGEFFYLLFEGDFKHVGREYSLIVYLNHEPHEFRLQKGSCSENGCKICFDSAIELQIRKAGDERKMDLGFELYKREQKVQFFPIYSDFTVEFDALSLTRWYV